MSIYVIYWFLINTWSSYLGDRNIHSGRFHYRFYISNEMSECEIGSGSPLQACINHSRSLSKSSLYGREEAPSRLPAEGRHTAGGLLAPSIWRTGTL